MIKILTILKVVDTSHLIKDESDIFKTSRVACINTNEQIMNMVKSNWSDSDRCTKKARLKLLSSPKVTSSPTRNKDILSRIYYEKTLFGPGSGREKQLFGGDRCFLIRSLAMLEVLDLDIFLVGPRAMGNFLLTSTIYFENFKREGWINDKVGRPESLSVKNGLSRTKTDPLMTSVLFFAGNLRVQFGLLQFATFLEPRDDKSKVSS